MRSPPVHGDDNVAGVPLPMVIQDTQAGLKNLALAAAELLKGFVLLHSAQTLLL